MTIALTSRASIKGLLTSSRDAGTATVPLDESWSKSIANGTGADQANAAYVDAFVIAAAGSSNVDLSGSLADPNNNTTVFTAIKELLIENDPTSVGNLEVGGAASNGWFGCFKDATDILVLKPGQSFKWTDYSAAGSAVTAGTGDILKLAAVGGDITGRIAVVGEA